MSTLGDGVRLAWGTLTAIPGPAPSRVDAAAARVAMVSGWLVVLPVTLAACAAGWALVALGVPAAAGGLAAIGLMQLATKGIHADGLADTADGIGSGRSRELALEIMRRSDAGPMGATTLILVLVLQGVLLGEVLSSPAGWLLGGLALASGRLGLALATLKGIPAARSDGLGQVMAGTVPPGLLAGVWAAALALGVGATAATHALGAPVPWWSWLLALGLGTAMTSALLLRARHVLGGITGDVLGACVEVTCLGILLGLAIG